MKVENNVYYLPNIYNQFLNSATDCFSDKFAIPLIKYSYKALGRIASATIGRYCPNLKERIDKNWCDPISSNLALSISKPVEHLALLMAERKPTERKMLRFLDVSLISSAQQLYPYLREVNYLLELPKTLRGYVATLSFDRFITRLANFFGKYWTIVSNIVLGLKYIILKIIKIAIKIFDFIVDVFTFNSKIHLLGYLKDVVKSLTNKIYEKFADIANEAIQSREDAIRKDLIIQIADYTTKTVVRSVNRTMLKTFLGLNLFFGVKHLIEESLYISPIITNSISLGALGVLLWKGVVKPTLEPYHATYKEEFDPNASYLMQFCNYYSIPGFYNLIKIVQTYTGFSKKFF